MLTLFLVILIVFQIVCSLIGIGGIIGVCASARLREKEKVQHSAPADLRDMNVGVKDFTKVEN